MSGFAYLLTAEAIRQFALTDASTSLSSIVKNLESNYKSDLLDLDQIASIDGFFPFEEGSARAIVKDFLGLPNIFTTVHMYRTDGSLVFAERRASPSDTAAYHPKPNFYQKDPEFIALARKVIEQKHPIASQSFFTRGGVLYQTYITPLFEDGKKQKVAGILSGGVFPRLKKIDYLVKGLKLAQDNFILVTDGHGNLIVADGIAERDANVSLQSQKARAAQHFFPEGRSPPHDAQVLVQERIDMGNRSFIIMSLPIPDLMFVVTLGLNTHPIDDKSRELSYRLFLALIIGLLLSLFASILVGERLAKPFRDIASTIGEINKGNFSARTRYSGDDEIGHLSERINTLAEKIEKSEFLGNLWSNEKESEQEGARSGDTPVSSSDDRNG